MNSLEKDALRQSLPYRSCVGIVLLNQDNKVFVGKRLQNPEAPAGLNWQMPQGGIDQGEDAVNASRRELYEETSIKTVSLLTEAPDWIYYDIPDEVLGIAFNGKFRGQKQRWFAYRFEGDEIEINVVEPPDGHTQEFADWAWFTPEDVIANIIAFKRPAYEDVFKAFAHIL